MIRSLILIFIVLIEAIDFSVSIECDPQLLKTNNETGSFAITSNSTEVGYKVFLQCKHGYKANSYNFTQCLENGEWSHVNNYTLDCKKIRCRNVYSITNGFVEIETNSSILILGATATIHCNNDQNSTVIRRRYCGKSGQWVSKDQQDYEFAETDLDTVCLGNNKTKRKDNVTPKIIGFSVLVVIFAFLFIALFKVAKSWKGNMK